ncbi:MAG: hypothetical protein ACRC3J_05055 [Culicoidibacterales bacterium]
MNNHKNRKQFFIVRNMKRSCDIWKLRAMFLMRNDIEVIQTETGFDVFAFSLITGYNLIASGADKLEAVDAAIEIMKFTGN